MQATLAATAATADGTSLLALAYHNHVVLYNTTTNTRIDLSPLPGIKSTASSTTAADEDEDDEDNGEDEAGGEAAEEQEGKDEQQLAEPKLAKVGQSDAQPKARTHKPLSTIDIMHAQNTLTAIRVLLFSPDARRLALADDNKRVTLYDTATGHSSQSIELTKRIATACFVTRAPTAGLPTYELMVADKAGDIHRLVFKTADLSAPTLGTADSITLSHLAPITALSFSPATSTTPALLFSSDSDGHTRLSRHPAHYDIHSFLLSASGVLATAVVSDRQLCFSGGVGNELTVWRYGEAGVSEVVQRVPMGPSAVADTEAVQFIGQLLYDARSSTLFVLSYPSSTIQTFLLSSHKTPSAASSPSLLASQPSSILVQSGQPSALCIDDSGRVFVLTDAAQLHVYVRVEDGSAWQLDERMQQLTEQVKAELTDVVAREGREAEEKAGSAAAVAPVWSIGMTVCARWEEKFKREKLMKEKQAQIAQQRADRKRRKQ